MVVSTTSNERNFHGQANLALAQESNASEWNRKGNRIDSPWESRYAFKVAVEKPPIPRSLTSTTQTELRFDFYTQRKVDAHPPIRLGCDADCRARFPFEDPWRDLRDLGDR